jgi:DnaK suppressor protein
MSTTSAVPVQSRNDLLPLRLPNYRSLLEDQWRAQVGEITLLSLEALDRRTSETDSDGCHTEALRVAVRLITAARRQLEDTEAALQRLETGTFGRCENCQLAISVERLEALPAARYCMPCQQPRR